MTPAESPAPDRAKMMVLCWESIADDLTGAGDASVQFAQAWLAHAPVAGLRRSDSAGLVRDVRLADSSVIAVTTDCRALDNDAAEKRHRRCGERA